MEEARATKCFCGCGSRLLNPRLVVTNTNGWELSDELAEWTKLEIFASRTGLDLSGGDIADNIQRGKQLWADLRVALHAGELADRDDEKTAVVWRKHATKARRKLRKQFRREGVDPFEMPDLSADELAAWITQGREPAWTAELDQAHDSEGGEQTLAYRLVAYAFDRRSQPTWEWTEDLGIAVAVAKTADALSEFREDYNLVLDAITLGYWIRQGEYELADGSNNFDPAYARQLREKTREDEPEAIIQVAMNQAREGLPAPFAPGPEAWAEVVGLATQVLAASGHQLMIDVPEFDEDFDISEDRREFALGLGYGLGVTAAALEIDAVQPRSG